MPFVVDNSVVSAWHLPTQATPYTDAVLGALADDIAHAPALWPLEFANVMHKALTGGKITRERVREIMQIQTGLAIAVHADLPDPEENLALALRYNLSSYDAAYLDLALRLRMPIATTDGALRDAALAAGVGLFAPKPC